MASLSIRRLVKGFGETRILKGVDVEVPEGGFCVLVGPSGCGKSTLLRCIAGLEEPSEGQILIGGADVTRLAPRDRDIAMVFQSYALYPHLTVADNLAFGLRLRKVDEGEIKKRVAEASAVLGLEKLLSRYPRQLSGGQRQRVAMGRAIVRRPKLFLFDEPLSNLDAALRAQVRVDIRRLHDNLSATSVYVTHDQVEAMTLADVMVVLNGGHVEQAGHPLDVYRRPRTRFVAGFLGSPSMSFVKAVARGGEAVLPGGGAVALPAGVAVSEGQEIEVGVRAEDVRIDEGSKLRAEIDVVEALGSETYVYAKTEGGTVVLRTGARADVKRGDRVGLKLDGDTLHLFDATSGVSLRAEKGGAPQ